MGILFPAEEGAFIRQHVHTGPGSTNPNGIWASPQN